MSVTNPKQKEKAKIIVGLAGMVLSGVAYLFSKSLNARPKKILIVGSIIGFIFSAWLCFTGWKNYAVFMVGSKLPPKVESVLALPVISVKDRDSLQEIMAKSGKKLLWLPCPSGGKWWEPTLYMFTRWSLPAHGVQCPNGRYLIKYNG